MQNQKEERKEKKKRERKENRGGDQLWEKNRFFIFFFKYNNTKNSQPHNINHIYLNIHYNLLNKKNYFN